MTKKIEAFKNNKLAPKQVVVDNTKTAKLAQGIGKAKAQGERVDFAKYLKEAHKIELGKSA